jgi:hypothetical protein
MRDRRNWVLGVVSAHGFRCPLGRDANGYALGAGILTGVLILRKPPPRIGWCLTGTMYL